MGTRSTTNGTFSITISSSWTGILFCIDSTYPSANGTSYWRQSADVDLSSMSITNGSKLYLSMAGSTTNTVRSAVTRVNNYATVNDTTRAVYIRKDYSPSTAFSYLVVRCWKKASPASDTYLTSGKLVSGSTNLYYFYLAANYDAFAFLAVVGSAGSNNWIYSGIREYSFNTIKPASTTTPWIKLVLAVTAVPTSSSTAVCTWMSNEQVTQTSSSYTSVPIRPGFFRVWVARPSLGFGSSTAYESTYLWTMKVINPLDGSVYEVVPHGYVVDDMWVGSGSSQRVLAFYDISASVYSGGAYGFICRPDSVTSTTAVQTYSSPNTLATDGNSKIFNLVYASAALSCNQIACEYSSMTLLKTVMEGYLSCEASPLYGYGDFAVFDQTWFSTASVHYGRCTMTANTLVNEATGSTHLSGTTQSDYDYNSGDWNYNGTPTASTSLALKYSEMYSLSANKAWGTNTLFGPIKTNEGFQASSTLLIVGGSGAAGFLFIAVIYLISRRKKKRSI